MNDLITWLIVYGSGMFTGWFLCRIARIRRLTQSLDRRGAELEASLLDQLERLKNLSWDDPLPPPATLPDGTIPHRCRPASMTGFTLN